MSNDNQTVAHLWAGGDKSRARSSNGNFWFDGDKIYSYSTCVAERVRNDAGLSAYVVNTHGYSNTTSGKHMPAIRRAIPRSATVFYVERLRSTSRENFEAMREAYEDALKTAARSRRYAAEGYERAEEMRRSANAFADFFGLDVERIAEPAGMQEALERIRAAEAERVRKKREDEARREAVRAPERDKEVAEWLAGQRHYFPSDYRGPVLLRVVNDELQTSMGARVPLSQAVRVFHAARLCRTRGMAWTRNGHTIRVGAFQVDRIEADGSFVAGCHTILWPQIEATARAVGVWDEPTPDTLPNDSRAA